jgi:hypothetical protein
VSSSYDLTLPPATGYRIAGNFIRTLSNEEVVARYHNHQWQVGEGHFATYSCRDRCIIHFEDLLGGATEVLGPFSHLMVADGTMYADEELFAKFSDETTNWRSYQLETYWASLIIRPAG